MIKKYRKYLAYPCIFFILITIGELYYEHKIQWEKNLFIFIGSIIVIYLFAFLYEWAKKPYSYKKE
ncbi:hypothetical protein A6M13_03420 [Caryophanon tenue]|uniref:Uncharacterized protein n=1 Tax=Caryophanon tenue TaxID=33978 RepID=A0A1C0YBS1_9BACL|nr:hypothetical protein A6M13_03420 [Caryophanon tenue]